MKAAPRTTITLMQIAAELAEYYGLPHRRLETMLEGSMALAARHLLNGDKVQFASLGTFEVRRRRVTVGGHLATGAAPQVNADRKIVFRPAQDLKKAARGST
jgi:nucleoid DNA-binding protein